MQNIWSTTRYTISHMVKQPVCLFYGNDTGFFPSSRIDGDDDAQNGHHGNDGNPYPRQGAGSQ